MHYGCCSCCLSIISGISLSLFQLSCIQQGCLYQLTTSIVSETYRSTEKEESDCGKSVSYALWMHEWSKKSNFSPSTRRYVLCFICWTGGLFIGSSMSTLLPLCLSIVSYFSSFFRFPILSLTLFSTSLFNSLCSCWSCYCLQPPELRPLRR